MRRHAGALAFAAVLVAVSLACVGGREWRPPELTHAFVGVHVVPMDDLHDGAHVLADQTVLVVEGEIRTIGPQAAVEVPAGAIRIDGRGRWLIPGLIDTHVHLLSDGRIDAEYADEELLVLLANGVTGARIAIGNPKLLERRDAIASGTDLGPRLSVSSPQLTGMDLGTGFNGRVVTNAEESAQAVLAYHAAGYDAIKVTYGLRPEAYAGIADTARELELPVVGHVGPQVGLERALAAGQQIEHLDQYLEALLPEAQAGEASVSGIGVWRADAWETIDTLEVERIPALAARVAENGVWSSPTLAFLNSSFGFGRTDQSIEDSPDWRFVSDEVREDLLQPRRTYWADPPAEERRVRYVELRNAITRELYRADAKLMAGSDSPEWLLLYGFSMHRELAFLVQAGLPPNAALEAATRNPAEFLGWSDETGSITVGKRADLVLLSADPLAEIANTQAIEGVMCAGRWFSRRKLDELLDRAAERLSTAGLHRHEAP